jgi:dienelactone hydrolase
MQRIAGLLFLVTLLGAGGASAPDFGYARTEPLTVRTGAVTRSGAVETRDVSFLSGGKRVTASLVRPLDARRHAGILFVHWLGDPKTTNRSEFLADAHALAVRGATSLLVDAMWAQPDWFDKRKPSGDYAASIAQVVALRRALDVLIAQPDVDPARIAYVGHDFGAMYGALVAGVDPRLSRCVFMTPTATFWEWYLLGTRPADKYAYIERMRALDPGNYLAHATMRATLLQFSARDEYVPQAAADEFIAAVPNRNKMVKRYAAGHALDIGAARSDRRDWLVSQLDLH